MLCVCVRVGVTGMFRRVFTHVLFKASPARSGCKWRIYGGRSKTFSSANGHSSRIKYLLARVFRGCGYPHLCCSDMLKQPATRNCVSDPRGSQVGKFHQETTEFHCFPGSLRQGAVWGYGLPWIHGHLLFRHCFRGTFTKFSRQNNQKSTPWIVGGPAPLDCNIVPGSFASHY